MNSDRYREWDGAYILGSLSASERREYERHQVECVECRASVAELIALPGLLARVSSAEALLLGEAPEKRPMPEEPAPVSLVSRLASAAFAARRRTRFRIAGLVLAAAGVSAAAVVVLPMALSASSAGHAVALDALPGVPVSASVTFVPEAWGTRIDMNCSYLDNPDQTSSGQDEAASKWEYVMYVTDRSGSQSAIGSWTSTPASTMHPSLSTGLAMDQIAAVDVRAAASGRVLLTGAP